jgi:hypothetical protein
MPGRTAGTTVEGSRGDHVARWVARRTRSSAPRIDFLAPTGTCWTKAFRLVIGRSRVRIPPRAPKPQVRGYFWRGCLRSGNGRSFLWVGSSRRGGTGPLHYVGVRPIDSSPVDGPPSSAHSGRSGGRTIGPSLRAGRAFARNLRKPTCGYAAIPTFRFTEARSCGYRAPHGALGCRPRDQPVRSISIQTCGVCGLAYALGPDLGDWTGRPNRFHLSVGGAGRR